MASKRIWEFPENTNPNSNMVFLVDQDYVTQKLYLTGVTNYLETSGFSKFSNLYDGGIIYNSSGWTQSYDGRITLPTVEVSIFDNPDFFTPPKVYTVNGGTTGIDFPELVSGDTNYISIGYNGGSPSYQISTDDSNINDSNVVRYLVVYRDNDNDLHILDYGDQGAGLPNKLNNRLIATQKFARESGLALGLSGDTGIPTLTAGVIWNGSHRQELPELDGYGSFYKVYHSSGEWVESYGNPYINNTYYDNGTDIVSGSTNKYLVNWYYRGEEREDHLFEVYGNSQYDNISAAQLSTIPPVPELISSHTFIVGRIIVPVGSYTGTVIETVFTTPFQSTEVTSHNDLSELQGGSAGQYYHLNANQYNNIALTNINNNFSTNQSIDGNLDVTGSVSANTYYGDASNLSGVITGGTFNNNSKSLILDRKNGPIIITGFTDYYVTGFTYSNNTLSIKDNSGSTFNTTINVMTGLTINGNLNVSGTTTLSGTTNQIGNLRLKNSNSGNTGTILFDTSLVSPANNLIVGFQNQSGTVALLSDLSSGEPNSKGYYYMENNAIATVCTSNALFYKVSGVTTTIPRYLKLFTTGSSSNQLVYTYPNATGSTLSYLKYNVSLSVQTAGGGLTLNFQLRKNSSPIPITITTNTQGTNQPTAVNLTGIVSTQNNDVFELWVNCTTNTSNVLVTDLTVSLFT